MQTRKQITFIEELAANAWPAETVQTVDGWRMRYTAGGESRRINSVWPNLELGDVPLEEKLDLVEAFYKRKQQMPRYQICSAAEPENLAEVLEERDYTRPTPTPRSRSAHWDLYCRVSRRSFQIKLRLPKSLSDEWLDFYAKVESHTPERKSYPTCDISAASARLLALRPYAKMERSSPLAWGWWSAAGWVCFAC